MTLVLEVECLLLTTGLVSVGPEQKRCGFRALHQGTHMMSKSLLIGHFLESLFKFMPIGFSIVPFPLPFMVN